ncbi:MAG: AAA family ATPase [Candidatus Hodarchaeales archaeon]
MEINLLSQKYVSTKEIDTILNLALELNRSILIEGPAGTGKTSVAISMAKALDWKLFRIQCYEGITVESVIGEFDYKKQLLAIELAKLSNNDLKISELENIFTREFFIERPLFQSFIDKTPNVLLIDEIDKSDEEFEALLLEALGERQITIPELGTFKAKNDRQLVVLTSNSSRDLSEPLRRRCLYLYIDFPSKEREQQILAVHTGLDPDSPLIRGIAGIIEQLRKYDLRKTPSIAETIDWAKALVYLGKKQLDKETLKETLPILIKYQEDIERIENQLGEIVRLGT